MKRVADKHATLDCLINVPVRVFISRKMPPYIDTFIKKTILRKGTNSPNLVVNKSWYIQLSLGRLLEGDPRHWKAAC